MNRELILLVLLQFSAHLLSDFYFQWEGMVSDKINNGIKSGYLYLHILITFIFSWLFSFQWYFWWAALTITLFHLGIDLLKSYFDRKNLLKKYLFFIDQALHIAVIIFTVFLFDKCDYIDLSRFVDHPEIVAVITGFIFILSPVNYFIKAIFEAFDIKFPDNANSSELKNAGKLIGNTERILILFFILTGEYEAIGFLLAAKSILRYNEKDTDFPNKTEYVLAGTLLSFTFAILTGFVISKIH